MPSVIQARAAETFPHNRYCPAHLRRRCGTCTHFASDTSRGDALCRAESRTVNGSDCALDCPEWERRSA